MAVIMAMRESHANEEGEEASQFQRWNEPGLKL